MKNTVLGKWFIDTDIGDDIDDAFALYYACKRGFDIVGVSTVYRTSYRRAQLAKHLLGLCGRGDIPVFAGMDEPLVPPQKPHTDERWFPSGVNAAVYAADGKWLPHFLPEAEGAKVENKHGVDAIIDFALQNKGLKIIAIGPLTNIAAALKKKPEIADNIAEIAIMGGAFFKDIAEWNFRLDPEAAHMVIHSGIAVSIVGSDLTWATCTLSEDIYKRFLAQKEDGAIGFLTAMLKRWRSQPLYAGRIPCMHDILPLSAAVLPNSVSFEERYVEVGLTDPARAKLFTAAESGKGVRVKAGAAADKRVFLQEFEEVFLLR